MGRPSRLASGNIADRSAIMRARRSRSGRSPAAANAAGMMIAAPTPLRSRAASRNGRTGDDKAPLPRRRCPGRASGQTSASTVEMGPNAGPAGPLGGHRRWPAGRPRRSATGGRRRPPQQSRHDVGVDADREDRQDESERDRHRPILDRRAVTTSRPVRRRRYHRRERRGPGGSPGLQNQWRRARRGAVGSTHMRSRQPSTGSV